jgi:putative membrane-bound dehydrogenase-like protein
VKNVHLFSREPAASADAALEKKPLFCKGPARARHRLAAKQWWGGLVLLAFALTMEGQAPKVGPLAPRESLARFTFPEDLELEQVLAEPIIAQPVFMNFDERGRMWVVQYLQYPDPAGLKVVSRDKYWRAVYDKISPPPPRHFPGKDKITIHEDTDGDGAFDKHTTFVDGLNIVTAVVRGRGGLWVLNPPYLLFYPDANNDDVPDGDPVVHLEGFGLEDTHSVVNSLRWGPDGWLYATQGSTVSGQVKRPGLDKTPVSSLGQHIWRYHPETRRYEIFAEGGGNAFGVEFDPKGRVYSGHNGNNTRGFHYVQGGYYLKGFDKHGQLSNPFAFGYFPAMRHAPAARFTHTFVIYEDEALPAAYRHQLLSINPLQSQVIRSDIQRDGSSFQTKDVGTLLTTTDTWFRPVDIKVGPDGAVYVADFYDGQIAHLRHHEGQIDTSNGRIYRLKAKGAKASKPPDLGKLSSAELVKLLGKNQSWQTQTVLRLLGDRKDNSVVPLLTKMVRDKQGQPALEALWGLYLSGGLENLTLEMLHHVDPFVRLWTVRLLADVKNRDDVPRKIALALAELAAKEKHVEVRSQLASSARRLLAREGLPIVRQLLTHDEDAGDIHLPLLLWWTLEARADSDREEVLRLFEASEIWRLPLVEQHILGRLMRRFAQAGKQKDLLTCAKLLRLAPGAEHAKILLAGFEQGFAGRPVANLPRELVDALAAHGGGSLTLRLRQGQAEAVKEALQTLANPRADAKIRLQLVQIFGEIQEPRSVPLLLQILGEPKNVTLHQAVLLSLQSYKDGQIAPRILAGYAALTPEAQSAAQLLLSSRATWSLQLLQAIDQGKIDKNSLPSEMVRKLLLHREETIQNLVRKHWGEVKGATTAEMRQDIDRLARVLHTGSGDPYGGRKLFQNTCGKCHLLFGQGGDIGPDLTASKRDDIDNMLLHIVNPSAEIREGFETYHILTDDGRTLLGFVTEKDNQIVALRNSEGQTSVIQKTRIEDMRVIPQSVMPEALLKGYTDQQVRDLFAYLRSSQPLNVKD